MQDNRLLLEELFDAGSINLQRDPLLDQPPETLPEGLHFNKIDGMMLGLAIGDALLKRVRRGYAGILFCVLVQIAANLSAGEVSSVLLNPMSRDDLGAVVRLKATAPGPPGSFVVRTEGREVPYQVEAIDGRQWIWVYGDFPAQGRKEFQLSPGTPAKVQPKVSLTRTGDAYVLDNGRIAVRVPAEAGSLTAGPIAAVRLPDGRWVGGSDWQTDRKTRKFSASVVGDGTLFAKVRLRWDFDGKAGLNNNVPAFAEVDVALGPDWQHVEIAERHEMGRSERWELELSRGWKPTRGIAKPFSSGPGSGSVELVPAAERPLLPLDNPSMRPDLFLNLVPRWNQHYKDGWAFCATDAGEQAGAVVVRASHWCWPHENAIEAVVRSSGDYAGLRCPTWKGRRLWWLVASAAPVDPKYLARYAWEHLDKLNHEMILDWPGREGKIPGINFYDGGQVNPTGPIRRANRAALANAGKPGNYGTLALQQVLMHSDAFGNYWLYWSPENANFFSDFYMRPIVLVSNLKAHPRYAELRQQAILKVKEDLYHSITLPGGAGQECPGYMSLEQWSEMARLCKDQFGCDDPWIQERLRAAESFRRRISQPDGPLRRRLPMGDTHNSREGGPYLETVSAEEVRRWKTEELPGFGVIFTSRPGTPQETYLAFKSGPNRGHYHGDQLAFHYCARAKAVAVDHRCSYKPRAGQEHMHNRVAFHTPELPWANMDGYERLIAVKTSPLADVAVGQVESNRLRACEKLPPEIWHQEYPQVKLTGPLVYRRTVVLVKGGPEDYFVIRDQYAAPRSLGATYCLHVLSDKMERRGDRVDFGNLTLYCAAPASFSFDSFPWEHDNGGREATQGARLTIQAERGEFVTVLYPGAAPAFSSIPGGVRVAGDEIVFAGGLTAGAETDLGSTLVSVKRSGRVLLTLAGREIDMERFQGEVGLFVPDAGYPFGDIPDWLLRQRAKPPAFFGKEKPL